MQATQPAGESTASHYWPLVCDGVQHIKEIRMIFKRTRHKAVFLAFF